MTWRRNETISLAVLLTLAGALLSASWYAGIKNERLEAIAAIVIDKDHGVAAHETRLCLLEDDYRTHQQDHALIEAIALKLKAIPRQDNAGR